MFDEISKLSDIFAPHEARRRADLLQNNRSLVHYTSAESAISIIRGNEVWMKNVRCMNDFREVEHGFDLLRRAYQKPDDNDAEIGLRAVCKALDEIFPDLANETISLFDHYLEKLRLQTHIVCLSEHDKSEDDYGRLSMWRGYGSAGVGVGLVINPLPLYAVAENFGAYSSPVFYSDERDVMELFLEVAQNIRRNVEFVASTNKKVVKGMFFLLLRALAICSKHKGFSEEQEWRIMHTKDLDDRGALDYGVQILGGVPQPVFKLSFNDRPDLGMTGISIPNLLKRVIIGPTQYPLAVFDAFCEVLAEAGVKEPQKMVVCSDIPLRT